ncbi:hypothetical protein Mgra_00008940 [Meloidogyne graminicola]|uniref:Uncharacterized protein n=1 Tax=Meloidogyne graminicola TaxID=189291 RepID=A0A8S9ZEA3_9BILA|nr:hypothetical protein Mgra_00008940 [Meloidogyne graminicola]
MSNPLYSHNIVRRILLITLISFLYTCLRTYQEYQKLIATRDETTAISVFSEKEAEIIRLQQIIKEEVRAMQSAERIRSERKRKLTIKFIVRFQLISSLMGMLNKQKSLPEVKPTQTVPETQKATFRLNFNFHACSTFNFFPLIIFVHFV